MKKFIKILTVLMIVMMIVSTATMVFAAIDPSQYTGENKGSLDTASVDKIGNQLINILSVGGSIISVIILIVLGIKYMMGSAEEKAEYKKTLMPYVIGAALVFAASALAGIIFGFAQNLGK